METLILIAILAVGASALYVAATFGRRTNQSLAPLERSVASSHKELASRQKETDRAIGSLQTGLGQTKANVDRLIVGIDQIKVGVDEIQHSISQIKSKPRQDVFSEDLERISNQLGQLEASVTRQGEMISMLDRPGGEQGAKPRDSADPGLEFAMRTAESYVAGNGWGQPPQLFSLARKSSFIAEDPGLAERLKDAAPDALVPLLQDGDKLPAGQPLDALAEVHWPDEVVGCVLVTEVMILPPEAENDAPDDPGAVERWATKQSAAQEGRLAVAVTRDGGRMCGLRLKDADGIQVDPDLADDLVTALLLTF